MAAYFLESNPVIGVPYIPNMLVESEIDHFAFQRSRYVGILQEIHRLFEYAMVTRNTHAFETNLVSVSGLLERFYLCVNVNTAASVRDFFDEPASALQLLPPLTPTESQASSAPSELGVEPEIEVAKQAVAKQAVEPKLLEPTTPPPKPPTKQDDDVDKNRRTLEKARVRNTFKGVYMPKKHTESSPYEARMVHPITKRKHTKRFGTAEDAARYYNLCMLDMYRAANMSVPDRLLNKF